MDLPWTFRVGVKSCLSLPFTLRSVITPLNSVVRTNVVDPKDRSGSGSVSFHHQAKIVRKTLIYTVSWLLYEFIPVFRILRIRMFLGLLDPHPDPLETGTDPRIRIRTKMSRIHNTGPYPNAVLNCLKRDLILHAVGFYNILKFVFRQLLVNCLTLSVL